MCGITGIFAFNLVGQVNMIHMAAATAALHKRGPDNQNTYHDLFVGLGHRRLSVIDPGPQSNQPMSDPTGRYQLVYNGEIYNFREIRKSLEEKGQVFRTQGDTEVLLHQLILFGAEGLKELNGFFSFAFYDRQQNEILLAIDRSGIKPLYYLYDSDKFIFGSEMKAITTFGIEKKIDKEALFLYFQLNYLPPPLTIYQNIKKLGPGQYLKVRPGNFICENWISDDEVTGNETDHSSAYNHSLDTFRKLMSASVQRRLVADVPVGTFLSGGIDSSIVTLLARRHKPDIEAFSIGFEDPFFDESAFAKAVAKKTGVKLNHFTFTETRFEEVLFKVLDYMDEPFADSSALAYWLLCHETRKYSTVALSGDGADELFGGYNKHLAFQRSVSGSKINTVAKMASPLLKLLPGSRSSATFDLFRKAKRYSSALHLSEKDRYWQWAIFQDEKSTKRLFEKSYSESVDLNKVKDYKDGWLWPFAKGKGLREFLITDYRLVLPGDMLTKADRMSMANSLEVRVPFLDKDIIKFAFSLPDTSKIEGKQRKRLLYDAYREELPPELYHRKKRGFEVPLLKWLRSSMKRPEISRLFAEEYVKAQGIFDPQQVKRMQKVLNSSNPGDMHATAWAYLVFQWTVKK